MSCRPHLRLNFYEWNMKNEIRLLTDEVLKYHPYTENNMTCPKYIEYDIMIG